MDFKLDDKSLLQACYHIAASKRHALEHRYSWRLILLHLVLSTLQIGSVLVLVICGPQVSSSLISAVGGIGSAPWMPPHGRSDQIDGLKRFLFPEELLKADDLSLALAPNATERWHRFSHVYSEYLTPHLLSKSPISMLEISLQLNTASNLWLKTFPQGNVYGLEYSSTLPEEASPVAFNSAERGSGKHSQVFRGSQGNETLLREIGETVRLEVGRLDFVVDSAGLSVSEQAVSFSHLFPLVKPGGLYFLEHAQISQVTECHALWSRAKYCSRGGHAQDTGSMVDSVKSLLDFLSTNFSPERGASNKLGAAVVSEGSVNKLVGSVQCWQNLCAIRRKLNRHF